MCSWQVQTTAKVNQNVYNPTNSQLCRLTLVWSKSVRVADEISVFTVNKTEIICVRRCD